MINRDLKLNPKIFKKDIDKVSTKEGWGEGLLLLGERGKDIIVLSADTKDSVKNSYFSEKYPDKAVEVGVAEQTLVTVASGMAAYGVVPYISTYAVFSPGRNWEQIRTTIALNDVPVKIGGAHTGLSVGADGATHQALEDIALMRVIPNMIVVSPCDFIETKKAVVASYENKKPTYIRFAREKTAVVTTDDTPFEIGKAEVFWEDKDPMVTIISSGIMIYEALKAAKKLSESKITSLVVNLHTIKPIDKQCIIHCAKISGCIVTVEDHQIAGGMGSAVSEVLSQNYPVPIEYVGVQDSFGESGTPSQLYTKHEMTYSDVVSKVKKALKRKNENRL